MRTRKQRFISALLAVAMMFVMLPVGAVSAFASANVATVITDLGINEKGIPYLTSDETKNADNSAITAAGWVYDPSRDYGPVLIIKSGYQLDLSNTQEVNVAVYGTSSYGSFGGIINGGDFRKHYNSSGTLTTDQVMLLNAPIINDGYFGQFTTMTGGNVKINGGVFFAHIFLSGSSGNSYRYDSIINGGLFTSTGLSSSSQERYCPLDYDYDPYSDSSFGTINGGIFNGAASGIPEKYSYHIVSKNSEKILQINGFSSTDNNGDSSQLAWDPYVVITSDTDSRYTTFTITADSDITSIDGVKVGNDNGEYKIKYPNPNDHKTVEITLPVRTDNDDAIKEIVLNEPPVVVTKTVTLPSNAKISVIKTGDEDITNQYQPVDGKVTVPVDSKITLVPNTTADGDAYEWTVDGVKASETGSSFIYTVEDKDNVEIGLTVLKALKLTTEGNVDLNGAAYTTDENGNKTYTGNGWTYTKADNTLTITGAGEYDLTKTEPLNQTGENVSKLACNVVLGNGVKAKMNSNNNVTVKQGAEVTGGELDNNLKFNATLTVEEGGKVSGGKIYAYVHNEGTISGTEDNAVILGSSKITNSGTLSYAFISGIVSEDTFTSNSGTISNCLFMKSYVQSIQKVNFGSAAVTDSVFVNVDSGLENAHTITEASGSKFTVTLPDIASNLKFSSSDSITFVGSPKLTVTFTSADLTHINNYKISANSIPGVKGTVEQDEADLKTATFTPDGTKDIVLNQKPAAGEFTMTNDGMVFAFDYENHEAEIESDNYTDFEVKYYREVDGEEKEVSNSESGVSEIGDYIVKVVANGETLTVGHFSIRSPSLKLGDAKIVSIQGKNAYGDLIDFDLDEFAKDENGIYKIPAGLIVTIEPANKAALADSGSVFDHWDITGGTLYQPTESEDDTPQTVDTKKEQLTFVMPSTTETVSIKLMTRDATIDEGPDLLGVAVITGTAAVGGAILAWQGYQLGTELYLKTALPDWAVIPNNRMELAALLWRDAGQPAPDSQTLYSDIDANDADAQNAARWAVENELISLPDADAPDTFQPYSHVSRIAVIKAWKKAQEMKR